MHLNIIYAYVTTLVITYVNDTEYDQTLFAFDQFNIIEIKLLKNNIAHFSEQIAL